MIVVEPNEKRAALSREYVTENVLHPFEDDLAARIAEITNGEGASIVVEATASARNIETALQFLTSGGKLVFLSWYPGTISLEYHACHAHQVTACFPSGPGNQETTRATLKCLGDGSIVVGKNLTDVVPFAQAAQGYERIISGDPSIMGMVIDWSKP